MSISITPQPAVPQPAPYWAGYQPEQGMADTSTPSAKPYKRTGSTKTDLLAKYRVRIKSSQDWRDQEGFDKTWDRLIDLYRGHQFEGASTQDRIAVNIAFSTVNTIAPSVAVNYPDIAVNARQESNQDAADAGGAAVNYWWRHHDWRGECKRAVKDSLITGNGWVKVGWRYQVSARPLTDAEQADYVEDAQEKQGDANEANPAGADAAPTPEEISSGQQAAPDGGAPTQLPGPPDKAYEVEVDEPFVERTSNRDILIDPEATCEEDLKWIAQRLVVPVEDVQKDTRYNAAARKSVQADRSTNVRWRDTDINEAERAYSDDVQRCTLWEFYDIRAGFYCIFAQNGDGFLLDPTDFPYPYGHPFVYLGNYDVPDQFYCMGDLEALEPLQKELNAVRSDMMNHRKRWQRAYLASRDRIDDAAQNALLSDKDNRIVYVDGDVDLSKVIVPVPQLPIDPMMYQYSTQIENDVDLISGVSEYQRGAQSEIRRTATEAAMIQDASNARAADKLAQIEVFFAKIARRVLQLAQVYLTGDEEARILGPDGQAKWVKFDREAIQGEFDFTVEAGSTQPRDATFRVQQALQLATTLAPYVQDGTVDPKALVTYVLQEGFGVKDATKFLVQQQAASGPSDKIIETINYKDTPPDIQRQIEQQAGLQPSKMDPNAVASMGAAGDQPPPDLGESAENPEPTGEPPTGGSGEESQAPQGGSGGGLPPAILAQLQNQMGASFGGGGPKPGPQN